MNQRKKMSEGQTQIRRETKQKMTSSHAGWPEKAEQCLPWGPDPQPSCSSLGHEQLPTSWAEVHAKPCVECAGREEGGKKGQRKERWDSRALDFRQQAPRMAGEGGLPGPLRTLVWPRALSRLTPALHFRVDPVPGPKQHVACTAQIFP